MVPDINIVRYNSSFIKIITNEEHILKDVHNHFSYEDATIFRPPHLKYGNTVRLFNLRTRLLPYGLLPNLAALCVKRGWAAQIDPSFKDDVDTTVSINDIREWVLTDIKPTDEKGSLISPYDHQIQAVFEAVKYRRATLLAATNAGKSLIFYIICRYLQMFGEANIVLVVPTVALVHQMYDDFDNYSKGSGWDTNRFVHKVYSGQSVVTSKPITITTYHSIRNLDQSYFEDITDLLIDEAHVASSDSLKKICDGAVNAKLKIGMTGTLKADIIHPLTVQSRLGAVRRIVSVKQLQDRGQAAKTNIIRVKLDYSPEFRKRIHRSAYRDEMEFVVNCDQRNQIIKNFAKNTKGNTLLMFRVRDDHLKIIYDELCAEDPNKKYFMFTGTTAQVDKDAIKAYVETHDDACILGTEKSISMGISIRNLINFAFCHPTKSSISVLQSIGRMIRLHPDKEHANIFDFYDDLSTASWINKSLEHGIERAKHYESEGLAFRNITKVVE